MRPLMAGSRKRKFEHENIETPAHVPTLSENMAKGRKHNCDDRPRSRRWLPTREFKFERLPYFKGKDGKRDKSHCPELPKLLKKSSTRRNQSKLTSISTNAMPAQQALDRVLELFLRLLSDRLSDIDDDFDPDMDMPLSENEIESMREELTNYLSFEQNAPTTALSQMMVKSKEYIQEEIFPYIDERIFTGQNFRRTFVRMIRVLRDIRDDLQTIFSQIPGTSDWGAHISDKCIATVYSQYPSDLVNVVLDRLHDYRQNLGNNSHPEPYYIFEIAKYFEEFGDIQWEDTYIAKIYDDTKSFLETFDLQHDNIDSFLTLVESRVEKESVFASSFRFDSIIRQAAVRQVYTVFSEKFDEFAVENPQLSLANQFQQCTHPNSGVNQAIADRFFKVLSVYAGGNDSVWDATKSELKENIRGRGSALVHVHRAPNNNWDMGTLAEAIKSLVDHEKAVKVALRMPNSMPGLRTMLRDTFKAIFRQMFPRISGTKLPEDFLADFVEHIASNSEDGAQWQNTHIAYMKTLVKYIRYKEAFMSHLRARIRKHDIENIEGRNKTFLKALMEFNRVTPMPQDLIESVRQASRPRLTALEAVERQADVISIGHFKLPNVPQGVPISDLTDIQRDAMALYTISINRFCGQRQNVYVRMTKMQLDVFNLMLQFERCSMEVVEKLISRTTESESESAEAVANKTNMVVTSLRNANLLEVEEDNGQQLVRLGNPSLTDPYFEVGPVDPEHFPAPTDIKYKIDCSVVSVLSVEAPHFSTYHNLFTGVFIHLHATPLSYTMLLERIDSLITRNFLTASTTHIQLVPF